MKIIIVIPARLSSTRLPEKPLIRIKGKSIIQRTYERCLMAYYKDMVYVATDSSKIETHCKNHGMNVVMTSEYCQTGTDRVAEFSEVIHADYYINVQGDEPVINPDDIKKIESEVANHKGKILNGYAPIKNRTEYESTSIPKVVFRPDGRLLYMSRSPIPGNKKNSFIKSWKQICIYAYSKEALKLFSDSKSKGMLEGLEDIEILRFLELGKEVQMIEVKGNSLAVDTPNDLEKVKELIG